MTKPYSRSVGGRPEYVVEAIEHLVSASSPTEAFGALSGLLLSRLSCQLVVLQVKVASSEPLLLQGGGAVTLPGIGVGWRTGDNPQASALAEGEFVVHDDLHQAFTFGEDANLARAGLRSAVRGALFSGNREVGRFGLFAEAPSHFGPERVQFLREIAPMLIWLCRQAAVSVEVTTDTAMRELLEEAIKAGSQGIPAALRACQNHLARILPAAGVFTMLTIPAAKPVVLLDRVGIALPGLPETDDPTAWQAWLNSIPPEGQVDSVAWVFPVHHENVPVGALGVAFPQESENPDLWYNRLRPMITYLAMLVDREYTIRQADRAARSHLEALASGLADEIGNLMTELALQVDLLRQELREQPGTQRRTDALTRLVEKGTSLSARLEQMAIVHRNPERWEPLGEVVTRVVRHLRTYRGGERLIVESQLGEFSSDLTESGALEHALTQLLLRMAHNRTSEVRVSLRGHRSLDQSPNVVLWLSEEHEREVQWNESGEVSVASAHVHLPQGMTDRGGRTLLLEIPVRVSS